MQILNIGVIIAKSTINFNHQPFFALSVTQMLQKLYRNNLTIKTKKNKLYPNFKYFKLKISESLKTKRHQEFFKTMIEISKESV